jgi:energy-coupling factor transporter ATP-binding protein EcfA2
LTKLILSTRHVLELMLELQQLADQRAQAETAITAQTEAEQSAAEQEYDTSNDKLHEQHTIDRRELENEFAQAKLQAAEAYGQHLQAARQHHDHTIRQIDSKYAKITSDATQKQQETNWQAHAVFDASKDKPQLKLKETNQQIELCQQQTDGLERDAQTLMTLRRLNGARFKKATQASRPTDSTRFTEHAGPQTDLSHSATTWLNSEELLQETIRQLHQEVLALEAQRLPSLMLERGRWFGWWLAACLVVAIPSCFSPLTPIACLVVTLAGASVLTAVGYALLLPRCRRQSLGQFKVIRDLLHVAHQQQQAAFDGAAAISRQEAQAIIQNRNDDLEAAESDRRKILTTAQTSHASELEHTNVQFQIQSAQLVQQRDEAIQAADKKYSTLLAQLAAKRQTARCEAQQAYTERRARAEREQNRSWHDMAEQWQQGFQRMTDQLAAIGETCGRLFPDWSDTSWKQWQRPEQPPRAIRFGHYPLPLAAVKNGLSSDDRLLPEQTLLDLPALMTLDEQPRLVLSAGGQDRSEAIQVLQMVMLRFLTDMPAGKLRMTIIDPTGLGDNFSAFMHLADIDEQLIGQRIWTDGRQIDQRLSLLIEHLENVLQKYLRNEYTTIEQYNQQAGEVAEPYHLVVVANFPAGFSDAAAEKLLKIVTGGPRCGVYPLLSLDNHLRLPDGFQRQELLEEAVSIEWRNGHPVWDYPLFEKLTLKLDPLPPSDRFTEILRSAGRESHEASRVEVPFALVAPPTNQLWTHDSERELTVPIGRAGANQLQSLRLGIGTAQHGLISGKTGSGKSSLLHALITNLALHYSPDQVEFYLVDFKKGVEFKTYATAKLPHARVIAVESEREFGVSVLERLDAELRQRGELYRNLGVQDLAGYRGKRQESGKRGARGERSEKEENELPPLPRILLVIDEFQELFVSDDKLAQDAALLLDRLVRQGRAFGIHVLLGSQTLSGAYSLARSTLGQMAVRIALECSDADAHLILSDDNPAARLLSRPGEAIYNDQNGMVAGNRSFQVVWLPDDQRQQYLAMIGAQCLPHGRTAHAPIVFEGNVPADPRDNRALQQVLLADPKQPITEPTIWLGSSVRIEPPTELAIRRQGGYHLLIVGPEDPFGILATALVALVAQGRPGPMQLTLLDGARPETDSHQAWHRLIEALPLEAIGCLARVAGPSDAAETVSQLADEVARRGQDSRTLDKGHAHPPHYVILYDLAQFRELRRSEDDFSFSTSSSQPVPADRRFRELLREGPAVGVHLLVWCDSYNSLTRSIDRLTLRDIDYRIVLPMSAADSSSLIDSPAAGRLGENRALFYRDDLGTHTKFRPYQKPTTEWLAWAAEQLRRGGQ